MRFDYASPSALISEPDRSVLGLTSDRGRGVRFRGRVKPAGVFLFRPVLRALGEVIWSAQSEWGDGFFCLDPIVTVHSDRVFFEAFSSDCSVYARLDLNLDLFEELDPIETGTTNIDFTGWFWASLGEMRSRRHTWLSLSPEGVELKTVGGGGRFEKKVEVPSSWVRGLAHLQAAMALPGTRLSVRPVELLAAVRFLAKNRSRISPRALRYEFPPGENARLVLEPWEQVIDLKQARHHFETPKTVRVWGRRRLKLLQPLLPFAEDVDVYLKGRSMPSFYHLKLPEMRFLLGLTGRTRNAFTEASGFALLVSRANLEESALGELEARLKQQETMAAERDTDASLFELCRRGLATYDLDTQVYRYRPLFSEPRPPDPEPFVDEAAEWLEQGQVTVETCQVRETTKSRNLAGERRELVFRDWVVDGQVAECNQVHAVVNEAGRIIFGRCSCQFFQDNLLAKGPCPHLLALVEAARDRFQEGPSSRPALESREEESE